MHHRGRILEISCLVPKMAASDHEPEVLFMNRRPTDFRDYIGQDGTKLRMEIEIHAAKTENIQLRHILIAGSSGLGKTTLAKIIASQFNHELAETTGPAIKNQKALIAKIKSLKPGGFLFIDEIHKLNTDTQEYLLVVLEDFQIDEEAEIDGVKTLRKIQLEPFTVIGATTRVSDVDSALRGRFSISETLEPYKVFQICEIIRKYIIKRGYDALDQQAIIAIANRSRQTPRRAISLTDGVLAYSCYNQMKTITWGLVEDYFTTVNKIDVHGLSETDHRILRVLLSGPMSLKRWACVVGETDTELAEIYEPYYNRIGLIDTNSKGRWATQKLFAVFGIAPKYLMPQEKGMIEPISIQ